MRVERAGMGAFPFQAVDLKIYWKKLDYNLAGEFSISCDRILLSERVGDVRSQTKFEERAMATEFYVNYP